MGSWRTVRVFISSTFRDMHAERDHLVRLVFPELRERCHKRQIQLIDVDLRWGVSEEQAEGGGALDICLDEVDSCRPYFLGLLAHRYGYIPPAHDHSITADEIYHGVLHNNLPRQLIDLRPLVEGILEGRTLYREQISCLVRNYQWSVEKKKYLLKQSITPKDEQTLRSTFDAYSLYQRDRSFFFFRSESLTKEMAGSRIEDYFEADEALKHKLARLKQEIIAAGLPRSEYDDLETFGQQVLETLWDRIDAEFPVKREEIERDWLKEEADFHELFMVDRTRWFVGRSGILRTMHQFVEEDSDPRMMVMTGEPGYGKSALMARFTEEVVHRHPDWVILSHFVGASPSSTSLRKTLRRICSQLNRATGSEHDIPEEYKELVRLFPDLLQRASENHRTVLIIDAVNQFEKTDNAHTMRWLPQKLPESVKVLITTLSGEALEVLKTWRIEPRFEEVPGLTESETEEFVTRYLKEIRKEFPTHQIKDAFYDRIKAGNPLYILVALEELRVFPVYEDIGRRVADLPDSVSQLFDQVLERIERDFDRRLVERFTSLIACGRQGMTGEELQTLLKKHVSTGAPNEETAKIPDMLFARLRRTFGSYLFERSGVIDFFHLQLKEAVGRRYLAEESTRDTMHKLIAGYFQKRWSEPYLRALDELPHQLTKAKDWDGLELILCDLHFIEAKCVAGMTYELIKNYNIALDVLPEAQSERQERLKHEARLQKYIQDLIDYAKGETEHLYVIPSVEPWSAERISQDIEMIVGNPTRLDRIKTFSQFVISEGHALHKYAYHPGFVIQQACNSCRSGPVADAAEEIINSRPNNVVMLEHPARRPCYNPHPALLITLEDPIFGVCDVGITPDGRKAVSGGSKGSLYVWDLDSGECLGTLEGHGDTVNAVSITPDGQMAVSGSTDKTLKVWDLRSGECLRTLEGHTELVKCVCITPDGRRAVSASADRALKVWDLERGECIGTLEDMQEYFVCDGIGITADGKRIVSARYDHSVEVWDVETWECLKTLEGHSRDVLSVSITPDGGRAVSASVDKTIKLWDLETGKCLRTLKGHGDVYCRVSITPDGRRAVSTGHDKTTKLWDLDSGECLRTLSESSEVIIATADGRKAISVSGDIDWVIRVWDLEWGAYLPEVEGGNVRTGKLGVTPDGSRIFSVGANDTMRMWDMKQWDCILTTQRCPDTIRLVSATPDGKIAITEGALTGRDDKVLKAWDLEKAEYLSTLEVHADEEDHVCITGDGKRAVVTDVWQRTYDYRLGEYGTMVRTLRVWDLENGKCMRTLEGETDIIQHMCLSPDCRKGISISRSYAKDDEKHGHTESPDVPKNEYGISFWVWDFDSGQYLSASHEYTSEERYVEMIASDKRAISKLDYGSTLRVWDVETGECLGMLRGHTDTIWGVCITRDGRRAVSGSGDKTLKVWNLDCGECLGTLEGHTGAVFSVCITPDGKRAVSTSADGSLRVWNLETGECLKMFEDNCFHWVRRIGISADGKRAVLKTEGSGDLRVWDLEAGVCLHTRGGTNSHDVPGPVVSEDPRRVISADSDCRSLHIWDLETGEHLNTLEVSHGEVESMAVSPDGKHVVSLHCEYREDDDERQRARDVRDAADSFKVYDLESGKCVAQLMGHDGIVECVRISPDGRRAVSGSIDNTLRVWDLETGRCERTLVGHKDHVHHVSISPDGRIALSSGNDNSLKVWDLDKGECLSTAEMITEYFGVRFAPDGRTFVTQCIDNNRADMETYDYSSMVWDIRTGSCLQVLNHVMTLVSEAITSDGKVYICGAKDGTVRLWDLHTGQCLAIYYAQSRVYSIRQIRAEGRAIMCAAAPSDIVPVEFRNYVPGAPIVTAVRIWLYGAHRQDGHWDTEMRVTCPWCRQPFAVSEKLLDVLSAISRNCKLSPDQSPCLQLPDEAWDEPRLLSACPLCHKPLKYNPFIVDNGEGY